MLLLSKSTGYKIYWAGRYLERIENVSRMGLFLSLKGEEDSLKAILATNDVKDYLKTEFLLVREDIRSFVDDNVIASLAYMERAIYSIDDGEKYFRDLLQATLAVENAIENFMAYPSNTIFPKKQEEVREEDLGKQSRD
ncbi:hypothetical protein GC250_11350 [Sulfolobus metallicus DSM 6482 = JCM 9184]|uniref:DUF403 domain-containing protein n=1 Tax=Sulfuracidifex metallicus DSM 6482 = JCM 9184 TaxID=523847 RepID=A0A6A9QWD8_SULME|nr:hypothetical protein [Sulfuracidifex metallicus DSM 6482 = JCM 9184]